MSLAMEGFERLAGEAPGVPLASRTYDPFDWSIHSAAAPYPDGTKITFETGSGANMRGKAMRVVSTAVLTNATQGWARYRFRDMVTNDRIFGFNLYARSSANNNSNILSMQNKNALLAANSSVSTSMLMSITTAGGLTYGGVAATPAGESVFNKWVNIQIRINRATGVLTFRYNGEDTVTISGIATSVIDSIGAVSFTHLLGGVVDYSIDDFWCNDTLAPAPSAPAFLGNCKVDTLVATGNEDVDFTPNTPIQNYQSVSELPDDPATYNSSNTTGHRDLFSYEGAAAAIGQNNIVLFTQVSTVLTTTLGAVNVDVGVGTTAGQAGGGATSVTALTTPVGVHRVSAVNPGTGQPWTRADLDNLRVGYSIGNWPSA